MNVLDTLRRFSWLRDFLTHPRPTFGNFVGMPGVEHDAVSLATFTTKQFSASITWADVDWYRSLWPGPIALKGIMSAEDAREAVERGVEAIIVSNHGGRQLDHAPSPIEVLPEIVDAVDGRAEVILDGGIRRGSDVVKAIALGARACMIGKAFNYGVAALGERGVELAIEILAEGDRPHPRPHRAAHPGPARPHRRPAAERGSRPWSIRWRRPHGQGRCRRRAAGGGRAMTTQRLLVALTLVNLGLLVFLLAHAGTPDAHGADAVLRGRALEIVDDRGRVRASIKIQPGGTANGQPYPETVILRLIDPNGRPSVKLAGSEQDAGLSLVAESDAIHVILKAEDASASLKLTDKDGQEQLIKP